MTPPTTDDLPTLRHILARTTALLMDFDGPVCSVFAGLPAATVVNQLCVVLADGGHTDLPAHLATSDDPFEVLTYAATLGEAEVHYVNAAFTAHELEAIATARPTPGLTTSSAPGQQPADPSPSLATTAPSPSTPTSTSTTSGPVSPTSRHAPTPTPHSSNPTRTY